MKIQVKVKPGSKRPGIDAAEDGSLIVRLKSPPVDGKANRELIEVLARHFGVPKRDVTLCMGSTARTKLIEVTLPPAQDLSRTAPHLPG